MGYIGSGVQRFNTADGLTVTGSAEINSLTYPTADGSNGQVLKTNGSGTLSFGTISTDLVNDTSPQLGGVLDTNGNNIEFPDSSGAEVNRLKFGAGDDLQIYHDGNDSYINDTGTGNLRLAGSSQIDIISSGGEFMAKFIADGAAGLFHNNTEKLTTTEYGIDISGAAVADTHNVSSASGAYVQNFDQYQNFKYEMSGNVTLNNPSTEKAGQSGHMIFIQDGTGGRTLSIGTDYETPGGAGITLSTAANATDIVPYVVLSANRILLGTPQLAFS